MLANPPFVSQAASDTTGSDERLLLPAAGRDATPTAWNVLDREQDFARASMAAYAAFALDQQGMYCQA
jgi:hypothetical protein